MSTPEIIEIIKNAFSINDVCQNIYGYTNGRTISKIKKFIEINDLDISHFDQKNKNTKYKKIEKNCPICEKSFTIRENFEQTTCSFSCANHYFRSQKPVETKKKISKSLKEYHRSLQRGSKIKLKHPNRKKKKPKSEVLRPKKVIEYTYLCENCNNEFSRKRLESGKLSNSKFCNENCFQESTKKNLREKAKIRVQEGKHLGWTSRNVISYPEKFFKSVLEKNGIPYEFNKPIKKIDLGLESISCYFLDFYLPEKNIDLEIDGKQHKYQERKEHDKIRDEHLSKLFKVYRIEWKSINNEEGKFYIQNEIQKFLEFYNSN